MSGSLPSLNAEPAHHPDCCLSLSSTLCDTLTSLLQDAAKRGLVLSIGSGTGLLEAHLLSKWSSIPDNELDVEGVEVSHSVNKYLPEHHLSIVRGTWELSPRAKRATTLLFVYPRSRDLVRRYLQESVRQDGPRAVAWLGPKCDWPVFRESFTGVAGFDSIEVVEDAGLIGYEMLAMIKRARQSS